MSSRRRNKFVQTPTALLDREVNGTCLTRWKETLIGHRLAHSQSLYKRNLQGHFGCVNAIEFSNDGEFIASGGDDRRLLLWKMGRTLFDDKAPDCIDTLHISNINSCCFDNSNKNVATGGNDGQVIVHDFNVRQSTAVYGLSDAIYCLSPDPVNSTILATASDDGKAQVLDTRAPTDNTPFILADSGSAMHSIMYNPVDPRLLATANSKQGIALWDIRMPLKSLHYKSQVTNCMSVRFNSRGDKLLALRRRAAPVLFDIGKLHPLYEFDYNTYYNACTLKSCSFAGLNDEYVMSGSDDFCIYLWKTPTDPEESYTQMKPHMVLKGHRSIVNQVRYCPINQFIISSGVEKIIKIWSPYEIPGSTGRLLHSRRYGDDDEMERNAYSHEEYIHMVVRAGSFLSHDYSNGSMEEEPCMIAFFDSLIQREVEQTVEDMDESSSENEDNTQDDAGGGEDGPGSGVCDSGGDSSRDSGALVRTSSNDALMCHCTNANAAAAVESGEGTGAPSTPEPVRSAPIREQASLRPFYMDVGSSSDSDSEVDEIISAMYSRYLTSREQALDTSSRPSGKKISSVIARGKQRDNAAKKRACPRKLQRIREDLQHSGDQFLRDNATSMSILADVIDNFVDNLVANESSNTSQVLSDTNDGQMSMDLSSTARETVTIPDEIRQQTIALITGPTSCGGAAMSETLSPDTSSTIVRSESSYSVNRQHTQVTLEAGRYFMPELQTFDPQSFNSVMSVSTSHPQSVLSPRKGSSDCKTDGSQSHSLLRLSTGPVDGGGDGCHETPTNTELRSVENQCKKSLHKFVQYGSVTADSSKCPNKKISSPASNIQNSSVPTHHFHSVTLDRSDSDSSLRSLVRGSKSSSTEKNGCSDVVNISTSSSVHCLTQPVGPVSGASLPLSNMSVSPSPSSSTELNKYLASSSSLPSFELKLNSENLDVNTLKSGSNVTKLSNSSIDIAESSEVISVQFKKASRAKKRKFRSQRKDHYSSSEDEER